MSEPHEQISVERLRMAGCLVISLLLFLVCLLPFLFFEFASQALENLHLSRSAALLVLLGSLLGSSVNIPIARFPLDEEVLVPMFGPISGLSILPRFQRLRQECVVAINVGGCLVPMMLAIWLLRFILPAGTGVVAVLLVGIMLNSAICYRLARPIPRLGIALPGFVPAVVALCATLVGLGNPDYANIRAPVAFVIGTTGPLLGADLLHWKDFKTIATGTISIGGAGTWDGIVLSGLLASFLAGLS